MTLTSLHVDYQPQLGVLWALREIVSNAIDGEERNRYLDKGQMDIQYSKRTRILRITNAGITVPISMLLMGKSDSRGIEKCIGQFGEGAAMSMNVLARNHMTVTIYNGDEKWTPTIERSPEYGLEPVLGIKRRKLRVEREDYLVEVEGVAPELYEELMLQFLRLDLQFDEKQVVNARLDQRVLLQPQYFGRIYNKGVFVTKRPDLMYGYDLNLVLNRDRSFVDEWDLKGRLGMLLSEAVNADGGKFTETLAAALVKCNGVLEVLNEWSDLVCNTRIAAEIGKIFTASYGEDAIAVTNEEEVQEAATLGKKGVVCSPLVRRIVERNGFGLAAAKVKLKNSVLRTVDIETLGSHQRNVFQLATLLVKGVVPAAQEYDYTPAELGSPDVRFVVGGKTIYLPVTVLIDLEKTLMAVVESTCSADVVMNGAPLSVMARMVAQLASGTGSSTVALGCLASV